MKMTIRNIVAETSRFLLILGAALAAGISASAQCVYDGFQNSLSDIWRTDKIAPGALVFDSTIFRAGQYSAKITIRPGDNLNPEGTTERDELREVNSLNSPEGAGYSHRFSIFIPTDFPIVPVRLVLAQWKQREDPKFPASVNNPVLALRYVDGELFVTLQTSEIRTRVFSTREEVRGGWLDFQFNVIFDRTGATGFVQAWLNGLQIINFRGVTAYTEEYGYPPNSVFYFKMGLYRDVMDIPMTAYFGEYYKCPC